MADYGEALERESKVLARYHVVGAHGGAWIYEVDSHEEFERLLARAPVFNFARYDVYPLADMGDSSRPPRALTNFTQSGIDGLPDRVGVQELSPGRPDGLR